MTHHMTNEQIAEQYEAQGGGPIVHELTDQNRPATTRELLVAALETLALLLVITAVIGLIV